MGEASTNQLLRRKCIRCHSPPGLALFMALTAAVAASAQSVSDGTRFAPPAQLAAPLATGTAFGQSGADGPFAGPAASGVVQVNLTTPLPPVTEPEIVPPGTQVGLPQQQPGMSDRQRIVAEVGEYTGSAGSGASQWINLKAALEASELPLPISLATALQLSDARPLVVAAAEASAWVAEAQLQRAKIIKVPELDFGACYVRHDGYGPDFNHGVNEPTFTPGIGGPLNTNLNFMYIGGSLFLQVPLTDAIFQPLVARQILNARRFNIQTAKNDALLMTARAYFRVHQYRGQYAGALDVVDRGKKLSQRIKRLSRDLVPAIEVDRADRMLADVEQHAALARQEWRVASADLTQVLRLDPRVVIAPVEHDHLQITLIDPARTLDELMPIALTNRPELSSQRSVIEAADVAIRREKNRPLLPSVFITGFQSPGQMRMQAEVFGLGQGDKMNWWSLRDDVSLQLVWQLEGLGLGNLARIKKARGMESQAIVDLRKVQDGVVAQVTRAQADVQSAALRVIEAERSMREALITFEGNYEGLAETTRFENLLIQVYRPQEAVRALEDLLVSYDQYFGTVAEYNRAQFELFHALGYPARQVSALHPPGQIEAVDTDRPGYLPAVRPGPPPADR